jgi:hypothetical protein
MALTKEALSALIDTWGTVEDISTGVVLVGVVGEFVAELTKCIKNRRWKHRIAAWSTLAVIVGIAGELASQHRLSDFNVQIQALIEQETANANQEAGRLGVNVTDLKAFVDRQTSEAAASLAALQATQAAFNNAIKTANKRLVRAISGQRILLPDEIDKLKASIRRLPKMKFVISFVTGDWDTGSETQRFGAQLRDVLKSEGWTEQPGIANRESPERGLLVGFEQGDKVGEAAARAIADALASSDISVHGSPFTDIASGTLLFTVFPL